MFKKLIISEQLDDLLRYHSDAFLLLTLIARRARRESFHGLEPGQAHIGDYDACGLTEQRYRTSKINLEKFKIATFKATNKGTVATLCNSKYYDINEVDNNGHSNEPATDKQRTSNGQATTNKKKEERSKEDKKKAKSIVPKGTRVFDLDQFENFWTEYPRKIGKKNALKSWKAIEFNGEIAPEFIVESVKKHRKHEWSDRDMNKIPHPATYLNQERWNDEVNAQNEDRPLWDI